MHRPAPRPARSLLVALAVVARLGAGLGAGLGAAGCMGEIAEQSPGTLPTEGNAFLTVVGDPNVYLDHGGQTTIAVKYHDRAGTPLAGDVAFRIVGEDGGARLSRPSDKTNIDGIAEITLFAGDADGTFTIEAVALYTDVATFEALVRGPQPPIGAANVVGTYRLESQFDMVAGIPGTAGKIVNIFIDMTDDPNDPATFFIDEALKHVDSDTVTNYVNKTRPALDGVVNGFLLAKVPDIVAKLVDLGDKFGQIAPKFGVISELVITQGASPETLVATHTAVGILYQVDGKRFEHSLVDLGVTPVAVKNIEVTVVGGTKVVIASHRMPLPYGKMLAWALENVAVPLIDPQAVGLHGFLVNIVDCPGVGVEMADYIGFGSADMYAGACETGLTYVAEYILGQLAGLQSEATALVIQGEARPLDTNGDALVDRLHGGLWEGEIDLGPVASALPKPEQRFMGERVGAEP